MRDACKSCQGLMVRGEVAERVDRREGDRGVQRLGAGLEGALPSAL